MSRARKGCAFCDADREDWDYKDIPISLGIFGDYHLNIWVTGRRKALHIELEPDRSDTVWDTSIDIEYCPFCGTKLENLRREP